MAFRGFLIESKSYLNYPACGRWMFWRRMPRAWAIFRWMAFKDWAKSLFR